MKFIELVPGSKAWLDYRRKGIGASDSAAVLGISPFKTRYELYEEKLYQKDTPINSAMQRGIDREKDGIKWAENHFNTIFTSRIVEHEEYPWKFATLDGINPECNIILEVKFPNKKVHDLAKMDVVIDYYYCQVQSQIACTGLDKAYFLSCHNEEYVLVEVKRDDLFIQKMIEKEADFFQKCMVEMEEPELCDKDYVQLDLEASTLIDDFMKKDTELALQAKLIDEERKFIRKQVLEIGGNKSFMTPSFRATKFKVKGNIQYDLIPNLKDVNLEAYRKESREQWKISEIK